METSIDFYFSIAGIDAGTPILELVTFNEIATNTGKLKDTELLFSLQDQLPAIKKAISSGAPVDIYFRRDSKELSRGLLLLFTEETYNIFKQL